MRTQVVRASLVVVCLSLAVSACSAGDSDPVEASFKLSEHATAAEVGLPAYPDSKVYHEPGDSSSSANIGVSTPLFGFKIVAVKLESGDRPERVAAFYRQAMSKYGDVLECSDKTQNKSGGTLTCDSGDSEEGSVVYKVGTDKNQRIVAIKPHGEGTQFNLVHLNFGG